MCECTHQQCKLACVSVSDALFFNIYIYDGRSVCLLCGCAVVRLC